VVRVDHPEHHDRLGISRAGLRLPSRVAEETPRLSNPYPKSAAGTVVASLAGVPAIVYEMNLCEKRIFA
jgi:hypothetical protein